MFITRIYIYLYGVLVRKNATPTNGCKCKSSIMFYVVLNDMETWNVKINNNFIPLGTSFNLIIILGNMQ